MTKLIFVVLFIGLVFILINDKSRQATQNSVLKNAEDKVKAGRATNLDPAEQDALRLSNEKKDQSYHQLAKQRLKEKLSKYSAEDQLMHADLIKEFDSAITANPDFDPAIHNISIYSKIAKKYGRDTKDVEDTFLDMQTTQMLHKSEVNEFSKKAGF